MRWFQLFFQNPYSGTWTRTREPGPILRNQDLNRTLVGDPSIVREGKSATLKNNSTHCAGSICLLWIEWLIYIHHCPPVNNETWQGRNFEGVHYREIAIWTCKLSGIDIVYAVCTYVLCKYIHRSTSTDQNNIWFHLNLN